MKKNNGVTEGPDALVYTARLPPSGATLNYLAGLIRGRLKKIASWWRTLPAGKIAGIVLAVLRCDQRPGDLAGGNGVHRTTVSRWVREVVGLLAARAPRLDRALKKIARKGGGVVLPVFVLRRPGAGLVLLMVLSWACVGRLRQVSGLLTAGCSLLWCASDARISLRQASRISSASGEPSGHARDNMTAPTEWASMSITIVRAARWSASPGVSLWG
ncbi:hypothetical protein [Streptomyces resistomycificus]|uniref:hypothetical protein n=1 Tax=Streptomyces resistomycificus TaxID=67356 RepID=UPI00286F588E|nr:hypothetical protein [Streptomyces resistomycificus]